MAAGPSAKQAGTAAYNPETFHPRDPGETPVAAPQITYGQTKPNSEIITVSPTIKNPQTVQLSVVSLK